MAVASAASSFSSTCFSLCSSTTYSGGTPRRMVCFTSSLPFNLYTRAPYFGCDDSLIVSILASDGYACSAGTFAKPVTTLVAPCDGLKATRVTSCEKWQPQTLRNCMVVGHLPGKRFKLEGGRGKSIRRQNLPGHLHRPTFFPQLTVVLQTGQCLTRTFKNASIYEPMSASAGTSSVSS